MGSSLKIVDIWIDGMWHKKYISALQMFEQIINGQFNVSIKEETEKYLYLILCSFLKLKNLENKMPNYIFKLFMNMIHKMQQKSEEGSLWINRFELERIRNKKLKCLLIGCGEFFYYFDIDMSSIKEIQRFIWKIEGEKYEQLKITPYGQYIKSRQYIYTLDNNVKIKFYLLCCSKYSKESTKCALFLYLNRLPKYIKGIQIEYNLLCHKKNVKYSHIATPQWLSRQKPYCGFQTFPSKALEKNTSITWDVAMKITDIQYVDVDHHIDDETKHDVYTMKSIQTALANGDDQSVMAIFRSLNQELHALKEAFKGEDDPELTQINTVQHTISVETANSDHTT